MSNLINDYVQKQAQQVNLPQNIETVPKPSIQPSVSTKVEAQSVQLLRDTFESEHKKNGLFEKFYNFLKNKTHFGNGSQKVEQSIDSYESGTKTQEEVENEIKKYRTSQKNAEQIFGDVASIGVSTAVYFKMNELLQKGLAIRDINGIDKVVETLFGTASGKAGKLQEKAVKAFKSAGKKSVAGVAALTALILGGFVKKTVLQINRISSDEFKIDKTMTKDEKKAIKKAKRKEDRKNKWSGVLYGAMTSLFGLAGGVVAIPVILASNLFLRYNRTTQDKKSFNDFAEKYKDNAVINTAGTLLMAIPMIKKSAYMGKFEKNLEQTVKKLKNAHLQEQFTGAKTTYSQLEDMLISSDSVNQIYHSTMPVGEKIKALTEENLFSAKFMQISDSYGELSRALREDCPSTRTIEQASEYIAKTFGNKYKVSKQLGVGTVAETYLAKDVESGQEVCIKILKEGITAEKIEADKAKFAKLIKAQITDPKEQDYLLRNLDDLANGIKQEVDFTNEMNAAKELAKYTKKAKVVKPIEVKDNIYVMERANGISLKTLQDAMMCERELKFCQERLAKSTTETNTSYWQKEIDMCNERLQKIKDKSPDFDLSGLTVKNLKRMLEQYGKVNIEQFSAIDKNGKVLHADIHPGNIFVDLEALKSGKGNLLTLIDTGNTINMSKIQAQSGLKLSKYIEQGNVKKLTEYVLEGATLPDNLTKEKAFELIEKELKNCFFDDKTKIEMMRNNSLLELTSNIMRKYGILPASTQLNFEKAKTSAGKSFKIFIESFFEKKYGDVEVNNVAEELWHGARLTKDVTLLGTKYVLADKIQNMINASKVGFKEWFSKDKTLPKKNSEEYLTYKLKQWKTNNIEANIEANMENMLG